MKTTVFAGGKVLWTVLVGALAPWAGGCTQAGDEGREGVAIDEPQKAVGEARLADGVAAQDAPGFVKKVDGFNQEADVVADGVPSFVKKFQGLDQEADVVADGGASFVKKASGFDQEADIVANLLGPNMKDTVARVDPAISPEGDVVANDLLGPNMKDTM